MLIRGRNGVESMSDREESKLCAFSQYAGSTIADSAHCDCMRTQIPDL